MYRQASRESRDGSTMGTARSGARGASRHERFVLLLETGVPAGLPCTDGRIRLIYAPGGETPGYLDFDFSQMAMTAGRPSSPRSTCCCPPAPCS